MGAVSDSLKRLNIKVDSPDRSIQVNLSRRAIEVRLKPDIAETHTDRGLAEQIEHALTAAMSGYERAIGMIRERAAGGPPPDLTGTPAGERRDEYDAACEKIVARGISRQEYVEVVWQGKATFTVAVEPGALRDLGPAWLAAEINQAVEQAARAHSASVSLAYRELYHSSSRSRMKEARR